MKRSMDAVLASGMVTSHVDIIASVAKEMNTAIMVRTVNPDSTKLIAEGYTTKDLHVKGKSSNWGPQAGFICCDQSLSKLASKNPAQVPAFNQKIRESVTQGYAVSVPLLISSGRLQELIDGKKIIKIADKMGVLTVVSCNRRSQSFLLYPARSMATGSFPLVYRKYSHLVTRLCSDIPALKSGYWVLYDPNSSNSWEPVLVLAEKESGIPLTADYDLFSICPHMSTTHFQRQDSAKKNFKMAVNSARKALGTYERRAVDINLGRITSFSMQVKDKINHGVIASGCRKVVHHGCEVDNPVTELDYPVTTVMPSGEVVGAETQPELETVVRDLHRLGFVFYANRLWSQKGKVASTSKVKQDYQWDDRIQEQDLQELEVLKA